MVIITKLGNMRKAVEWVIYPEDNFFGILKIQSDHRIAVINPNTGICWLSKHCPAGAYGKHLSKTAGATVVPISSELIAEIISKQPKPGDRLCGGHLVIG